MKKTFLLLTGLFAAAESGVLQGTLDPGPSTVAVNGILDMRFSHAGVYANPWEALNMSAEFYAPSGDTQRTGGFFCGTLEWGFRFSPTETGAWGWQVSIGNGTDDFSQSGSFTCVAGVRPGFLIISPDNPRRFAFPDGTPYYPAGLQMCWGVNLLANLDTVPVGVTPVPAVPIHDFVDTFAAAGYNFYRISFGNCAIGVEETLTTTEGNRYFVPEGFAYDSLMTYLHAAGYRIVLNPCFDCIIYSDQWQDSAQKAAVLRLADYIVDRWGAYADIWELNNEPFDPASLPLGWMADIIARIKQKDPYGHLIGQDLASHVTDSNYVKLIDVLMPHQYYDGTVLSQDALTSGMILAKRTQLEKSRVIPILYGEQGYDQTKTFFPASPTWQRLRQWSAFFSEGALTAWYMYPWQR